MFAYSVPDPTLTVTGPRLSLKLNPSTSNQEAYAIAGKSIGLYCKPVLHKGNKVPQSAPF
jgi:hypothetical protein